MKANLELVLIHSTFSKHSCEPVLAHKEWIFQQETEGTGKLIHIYVVSDMKSVILFPQACSLEH